MPDAIEDAIERAAKWKARSSRLRSDLKNWTEYIKDQIAGAETQERQALVAIKDMMTASNRHAIATPWGEVRIKESVSTETTDVATKWAKEYLPNAVASKVTLASLVEAGCKWRKTTDSTEEVLVDPDGEAVPGITRTVTTTAVLSKPRKDQFVEEVDVDEF